MNADAEVYQAFDTLGTDDMPQVLRERALRIRTALCDALCVLASDSDRLQGAL